MASGLRICRPDRVLQDPRCAGCLVRGSLQGGPLRIAGLQHLLQRSESFSLARKRTLYRQGAPAEAVYALRRGAAKLLREEPGEGPHLVRWSRAGTVIGLEALLGQPHRHTAVAIGPLEYCRIPVSVLRQLEAAEPAFHAELMRQWQANLDDAERFIATLGAGTGEQRLARLLLRLSEQRDGQHCVSLLRSDIGAALGVSMETASRLMARFRRRGLIRGTGRELVCDADALREFARRK